MHIYAFRSPLLVVTLVAASLSSGAAQAIEYYNANKESTYPISDGVQVGKLLYLSGKLGIDPATKKLAVGGITPEAKGAMEMIKSTLEAHKYKMSDIVKCTVFLADVKELPAFNEVYKTYFQPLHYPGRSAVGVSGLALDARVEVECIAAKP